MDKIEKRIQEERCLICKKVIYADNPDTEKECRIVQYKDLDILICRCHPYVDKKI